MDLNTIRQNIINSTREDWHKITCWGAGCGPSYRYGFSTFSGQHGVQTEAKDHGNVAILIEDVDISIAWGYHPDESAFWAGRDDEFDFSDFLPQFPDKSVSRMYADVFYRGSLVDRELLVVADGGRYYVPIPRTEHPHQKRPDDFSQPEQHYTKWDIGFASLVQSFEHVDSLDYALSRMTYVLDDDRPISSEGK